MLAVIALVIVWAHGKILKCIWAAVPMIIAAGISWVWIIVQKYPAINDNFLPTWLIDPHRQVIWHFVFEKFLEVPWTGHGVHHINFVSGADSVRADIGDAVISSHPHNWI